MRLMLLVLESEDNTLVSCNVKHVCLNVSFHRKKVSFKVGNVQLQNLKLMTLDNIFSFALAHCQLYLITVASVFVLISALDFHFVTFGVFFLHFPRTVVIGSNFLSFQETILVLIRRTIKNLLFWS